MRGACQGSVCDWVLHSLLRGLKSSKNTVGTKSGVPAEVSNASSTIIFADYRPKGHSDNLGKRGS